MLAAMASEKSLALIGLDGASGWSEEASKPFIMLLPASAELLLLFSIQASVTSLGGGKVEGFSNAATKVGGDR